MSTIANYGEVQRALQTDTEQILAQIPVSPVTLSMPMDGAGPRICASVKRDDTSRVPARVNVVLDGNPVEIVVEAVGDYQDFKAL